MEWFTLALPVIQKVAFALVILVVGLLLIRWFNHRIQNFVMRKKMDETLKPFVVSVSNVSLKILLGITIIGVIGIETTSVVAVLASAGFAIGLAFQGSLSNFAGGVLLLISRPVKVGDFIEADGFSGTVESIRILYTQLITVDNKVVHIPNGTLANTSIINYSEKETRRVDFLFGASYEAESDKVIQTLTTVLNAHPLALSEPEPMVRMLKHDDSAIVYTARVWVNAPDYWPVYFDVMETVKKRFDENGISIPYPQMDVHVSPSQASDLS